MRKAAVMLVALASFAAHAETPRQVECTEYADIQTRDSDAVHIAPYENMLAHLQQMSDAAWRADILEQRPDGPKTRAEAVANAQMFVGYLHARFTQQTDEQLRARRDWRTTYSACLLHKG